MRPTRWATALAAAAVLLSLTVPAVQAAHRVVVTCRQSSLVAGRRLWIVRHDEPRARQNTTTLLRGTHTFDDKGRCEARVAPGRYRFGVLRRDRSRIIALSTGPTKVDRDTELELKAQRAGAITVSCAGEGLLLDRGTFRVEGTMEKVEWSRANADGASIPTVVLSPGQSCPVRLLARRKSSKAPLHVLLWAGLRSSGLDLDVSEYEGWLSQTQFQWLGDGAELKRIRDPVARLYFPEGDHLDVPLAPNTRLVSNRRFLEMSYSYETASGEHVELNRRSHVLRPRHTVRWGGPLSLAAYAWVTMKWARPGRSLLWGAYLHDGAGDVVSTNEFPPEKPHARAATGHPTYLSFRQRFSDIQWKQTLHRRDGGPVPRDPENLSKHDLRRIGDVNRLHENYLVAVSYVLHGRKVERNVPIARFVTWRTKHISMEAPVHWGGRRAAYLDKMERIYAICAPLGRYTPAFIQMFWTNNYGAGYTVGPRSRKRLQMGFFDLRDRKGLYSLPDILVHEVLHGFGFGHGREHDRAIRAARRIFHQNRAFLADHPDYMPEPITLDHSIEDARNFGAKNHGRFARIRIPRDRDTERADLGPFRGHVRNVESEQDVLKEFLALKTKPPVPAKLGEGAVDVLGKVDLKTDAVRGEWTELDGQIVSAEEPYARFEVPVAPQGSYLLEAQFTRVGGDCVAALLPVGDTGALLVVSGWGGKVSGLAFIGGKDADRNATTRDGRLADGAKHALLIKVLLLEKAQARISVTLDGKPYIDWRGPRAALSPDRAWRLRHRRAVGLGAYDSVVVFHSCQLKMLSGEAKPLR